MDGIAWKAAVHGVAKSWTWLSNFTGNISCKDGHNEGQKWYETNRSRNIKKRWQQYIEELYKKHLNDPDNHDGMVTHLEPDILECEVKASWGNGILTKLFKILKYDAVKVLHSICQQIWKTRQRPQDWKRSVFIPIPKNAQTTAQLHSSHMLVK